jgi:osmoprotectant transport system permease protein
METLRFILANLPAIGQRTVEHVSIVGVAVSLAILTGVPIGIAITQNKRAADIVLYIAAMIMTIPSIALFGVMIPVLSLIGQGIGYVPAVIAVLLYSQLPIIRNTYTAISNIDPALREAARGMGMSSLERLRQVEIPLAVPVIMAGVRIAVVINIGITAIATYIGAGGLGAFISRGISQTDSRQLITGAIAVSLLAIVADYLLLWLQHRLTPVGIRTQRPWTRRRGWSGRHPHDQAREPDEGVRNAVRDGHRRRSHQHGRRRRRDLRAARTVRLRQDDDAEDDQSPRRADVGKDLHRRQGHRPVRSRSSCGGRSAT